MSSILIANAESDSDLLRCFPVMHQLRPHLLEAGFVARVRRMHGEGYFLARLEEDGVVCAVAGYRFHEKLFSGRTLYVDDLVSATTRRSKGHGARLLAWLVVQAKARDCEVLELDSGVQRFDAHRFYFRERMKIVSYHFALTLKG